MGTFERAYDPARPRRRLWRVWQHRRINCIVELLNNGRRVRPKARDLGRAPGEDQGQVQYDASATSINGRPADDATALRVDARPVI